MRWYVEKLFHGAYGLYILVILALVVNTMVFHVFVKQICHRDLKLENTLLDGSPAPRLKICDFGYSKVLFITRFTLSVSETVHLMFPLFSL